MIRLAVFIFWLLSASLAQAQFGNAIGSITNTSSAANTNRVDNTPMFLNKVA